jgi:hypothetical protein
LEVVVPHHRSILSSMTRWGRLAVVAAWSVGFAVGDVSAAPLLKAATSRGLSRASSTPDFDWSRVVRRGGTVEIKGVNGAIRARAARGDEARVTAEKRARRSDPDDVRIEVNETDDGFVVCAVYPTPRGAREENRCGSGDDFHVSTHNNDVVVDFEVEVPAGVRLIASTVNGGIEAEQLDGPIEATTVNGEVSLSGTAEGTAQTVNGSIHAEIGASRWDGELEFRTVNGTIELVLPRSVDADVDLATMNGHLDTEFEVETTGRISKRRLRGQIGDGGGLLKAETMNGSVRLLSAHRR